MTYKNAARDRRIAAARQEKYDKIYALLQEKKWEEIVKELQVSTRTISKVKKMHETTGKDMVKQ